ncbi:ankyrin repeat-containing domain protein [Cryomyces antarcticus]
MLLTAGAHVNVHGGHHHSALQAAAAHWDPKVRLLMVEMLLTAGADVDAHGGSDNKTSLQTAIGNARKATVQQLLYLGAEINLVNTRFGGALHTAVSLRHKSIVKMMMDAGADINAVDTVYGSPLCDAKKQNRHEIAQLLSNCGAKELQPPSLVECDACDTTIEGSFVHCTLRNQEDYDLCASCIQRGKKCSHEGDVPQRRSQTDEVW